MTNDEWAMARVQLSMWRVNDRSGDTVHLIKGDSAIYMSITDDDRIVGSIFISPESAPLSFRGRRELRVVLDYNQGWLFDELRARLLVAGGLSPKEDWSLYEQLRFETRGLEEVLRERMSRIKAFQNLLRGIS